MTSSEINTIGSLYTRNTTASSSSTTILTPSLSLPSEKGEPEMDGEEEKQKNTVEEKTNKHGSYLCHFNDKKQKPQLQPHYSYDDYQNKNDDPSLHNENSPCPEEKSETTIPIPAYMTTTTTTTTRTSTIPNHNPTTTLPSIGLPSSSPPHNTSPRKRAKRWMIAALTMVVGLLIALTFILIGLGKAISHHHGKQQTMSTNGLKPFAFSPPSLSSDDTHTTTTVFVVPATKTIHQPPSIVIPHACSCPRSLPMIMLPLDRRFSNHSK
ncbi:hypothetical protein BCR42DRAFT_394284 [Absidia repens]|uniref:Uncharacterized protein n=1 Tax=Absidia repens TaxID=90262 RepID=A0A1X2IBB0_9FUNG|nr:hypothetical protein BCR42DRAFT_394284 [Absidia repens]